MQLPGPSLTEIAPHTYTLSIRLTNIPRTTTNRSSCYLSFLPSLPMVLWHLIHSPNTKRRESPSAPFVHHAVRILRSALLRRSLVSFAAITFVTVLADCAYSAPYTRSGSPASALHWHHTKKRIAVWQPSYSAVDGTLTFPPSPLVPSE
jgi:hypothetical protein